jgi:hypothetical protein
LDRISVKRRLQVRDESQAMSAGLGIPTERPFIHRVVLHGDLAIAGGVEDGHGVRTIFARKLQNLLRHIPGKEIPMENLSRGVCDQGAIGGNQSDGAGDLADKWEGRMKSAPGDDDHLDFALNRLDQRPAVTFRYFPTAVKESAVQVDGY